MSILAATFLLLLFCFVGTIEGSENYHRCIKYAKEETKPKINNGDRYCLSSGDFDFCKSFTCPKTDCSNPVTPEATAYNKCPYCPGTCSYGGVVYQAGDAFACLDGSNRCSCLGDNKYFSTWMGQSPAFMCM